MDEEGDDFEFGDTSESNKKYTMFWIDGGANMFEGGEDCDFKRAIKAKSETKSPGAVKHCVEWFDLKVRSDHESGEDQRRVCALKEFIDQEDIKSAFDERFEGHCKCDLSTLLWYSRKIFMEQGVSQRQQTVVYITNDINPFEENWATQIEGYFTRMKKGVNSFRHQKGKRTMGDFSVVLLRKDDDDDDDETYEKDTRVWRQLDPNIGATSTIEDLETQMFQKTFSLRAFSNIPFELGPGVKFSVAVYALASEARPPAKEYVDYDTENPVEKRQVWMSRDDILSQSITHKAHGDIDVKEEMETDVLEDTKWLEHEVESRTRAKFELKKAIKIGGECIVSEQHEIEELGRFDAKGIVLLGFKPISEINFENHIQPSRFIYPDESNVLGSACLYRALLERCWERKMAMICRFCSRSNQKVRLVALVPHMSEKNESRADTIRDYDFDGFHVIFLPFAEDVRDVSEKMKCPQGEWPKPSSSDVSVASAFVKKLTGSYTPSQYENPRLQSFYAMIIENVVGEQIVKPTDTLLPYHARPEWASRVRKEAESFVRHFNLEELCKMSSPAGRKRADDGGGPTNGVRAKKSKLDSAEMDIREIAEKGQLETLTVAQLRAAIGEHLSCTVKQGTRKAEMVEMLKKYFKV
ncbi:Ku70/Ku80 beta-barrel domain protein [Necator americanus]|uniref:Ku70/Ku80 beta-barrel domain protein n=1 Tax=Necator americanus TaxID=51031 RepID=W2TX57_NECAM|nr:Ku70/Ku80 beta-barrel domain protein [Necator americanus]ETN86249.1 Ku70/Ku80 beta-barrel domain protein [Necator americanus]